MLSEDSNTDFISRLRAYIKILGAGEVIRRYFVMNAFDGALAMLGVILGATLLGQVEINLIISAGLGASLAMGVSGFFGAYMAEKAERERELRKLERALLTDLDDTLIGEASRFVSVFAAIVDGLSPALAASLSIIPYYLASLGILQIDQAFQSSVAINLITLFLLGVFLGKVSRENEILYGVVMTAVGVFTALLIFILSFILH